MARARVPGPNCFSPEASQAAVSHKHNLKWCRRCLQRERPSLYAADPEAQVSETNASRRVLIVDDQGSIRQLVRAGLRSLGFERISEAEDGIEALEVMASTCPDVVLLDANMPRLDGLGVLRAMRADITLRSVPVVILTGLAEARFVTDCRALGVRGFVLKPFTVERLGSRIDACFPAVGGQAAQRTA